MSAEIEALEQFFAAINRNDMQAITKDFDPQVVRIEPEGFPTAGTYRGINEVQEHAWVRLKGSTDWVGGRFADGFVFRNGKIVEYVSFGERAEALVSETRRRIEMVAHDLTCCPTSR